MGLSLSRAGHLQLLHALLHVIAFAQKILVSSYLPKHHLPCKLRPVIPYFSEASSYHNSHLSLLGLNYHLESGTVFTILYLVFFLLLFYFFRSIFCLYNYPELLEDRNCMLSLSLAELSTVS